MRQSPYGCAIQRMLRKNSTRNSIRIPLVSSWIHLLTLTSPPRVRWSLEVSCIYLEWHL
nr:hypothetical protein Iba_chr13bCG0290 [Ipomoea batatas]GMD80390.1 hypothetical protein Iba_chr13eCG1400 [Ipomoea batatas]GME15941.1 hypothetical protein Iba_scaffold16883CG0520 [Ipomoea batatas]